MPGHEEIPSETFDRSEDTSLRDSSADAYQALFADADMSTPGGQGAGADTSSFDAGYKMATGGDAALYNPANSSMDAAIKGMTAGADSAMGDAQFTREQLDKMSIDDLMRLCTEHTKVCEQAQQKFPETLNNIQARYEAVLGPDLTKQTGDEVKKFYGQLARYA